MNFKRQMRELRASNLVLLLILAITVWSASNIFWNAKHASTIVKADGKGYYAHLPALFIYHDLNFGFFDDIEKKYQNNHLFYDYRKYSDGHTYNKYFSGAAWMIAPFFLIAHAITWINNGDLDGYSFWYSLSVSWAAIFYLLLALIILRRILQEFNISDGITAWIFVFIYFGTNWFYYVLAEPAMSHVYSIALVNGFFFSTLKWAQNASNKYMLMMGICLGLLMLIRPLNAMVVLCIPIAFENAVEFKARIAAFLSKPINYFLLLIPIAITAIQLLVYYEQTGAFLVYSYEEEGFNFLNPEMINILFSYKKGLFLYTPILLVAMFGHIIWYKTNKWQASSSLILFIAITYLLSSWWNWYYGGSFSSRAYIEYYLFFALPFAWMLQRLPRNSKKALLAISIVLVLFCQFQTYQYRYMVIHWDNMDKAKYWEVFLNPDFILKK